MTTAACAATISRKAEAPGDQVRSWAGATSQLAVVVTNFNRAAILGRCLEAVLRQDLPADKVIVVDDHSTDGSVELIEQRYPTVEIIRLPANSGFARANNVAIRHVSRFQWVVLLNNDAFPLPDWLRHLVEAAARHPDFSSFASRMLCYKEPNRLQDAGNCYHACGAAWKSFHDLPSDRYGLETREVFSACAAAAMYRVEDLLKVGGFDESYFCFHEDVDLGFRLRLIGCRTLFVPAAQVQHIGSATTGEKSDLAVFHSQRNQFWTYCKNMPWPLLLLFLPQNLLYNLLSILWHCRRGQGRLALKAKAKALRGLPDILRKRREVQRSRKVSSFELLEMLCTGPLQPYSKLRFKDSPPAFAGPLRSSVPSVGPPEKP